MIVTITVGRKESSMRTITVACTLAVAGSLFVAGCSTAPKSMERKAALDTSVQSTIETAKATDPGLQGFFDSSAGYAVFPAVGKGAIGVGGAFGRGQLFENGQLAGYCSLTQATIGLALGGQSYTELIFFQTPEALNRFKAGNYAFSAQASAVAIKAGASSTADYADGVAVFTTGESGLMFEASVGGQKFSYQPISQPVASGAY
jgi:lipid-binding SYLF domain-containing protein